VNGSEIRSKGNRAAQLCKPAEWHTRSPVHEPIHTDHVIHTALWWVTFYTLYIKSACLLAACKTYSDNEHLIKSTDHLFHFIHAGYLWLWFTVPLSE